MNSMTRISSSVPCQYFFNVHFYVTFFLVYICLYIVMYIYMSEVINKDYLCKTIVCLISQ